MDKNFTDEQITQFWQHQQRFLKANLVTEAGNPLTSNLSKLCQTDLPESFNLFHQVELAAIASLTKYSALIQQLQQDIQQVLHTGHKIYLVGCGSSGRLAMLLKRLYQLYNPDSQQIICVSAGGDISLIKAVEQFEDNGDLGIAQLLYQGYTNNDLVIGLSASGESPFISSVVEYAAINSKYTPWLICNNPMNSLLERNVEHIVSNQKVKPLALDVGPMALTGSTRLQATTAMQIALGLALCSKDTDIKQQINQIYQLLKQLPLPNLAPITQCEADILAKNEFILYQTNTTLMGLSLLADITERSPTFNLPALENTQDDLTKNLSPFYLVIDNATSITKVWEILFGQIPTCLEWTNFPTTSREYVNGFDLSRNSLRYQGNYLPNKQHIALWQVQNNILNIQLGKHYVSFPLPEDPLQQTLIYKLLLNSHSTLMLGKLGYFEGNMMLSLKPSNFKLIDRAIRYSQFILNEQYNVKITYSDLANIVFEEINQLHPNQSIVNKVINNILNK